MLLIAWRINATESADDRGRLNIPARASYMGSMTTISIIALAIGVGVLFALAAVSMRGAGRKRKKRGRDGGAMVPLDDGWDI